MQHAIACAPSTHVDHNLEMYLSQGVFPLQYMFLVFKKGNPTQIPLPATMTPKAITSAHTAAQALFLPIDGHPSNNDLVRISDAISPILLKATYNHINDIHNLWGLVASVYRYVHHYSAPFVRLATHLVCYDPEINAKASRVDCICAKTARAALIQDMRLTRPLSIASRSSLRP
jgi:hypothetical protein